MPFIGILYFRYMETAYYMSTAYVGWKDNGLLYGLISENGLLYGDLIYGLTYFRQPFFTSKMWGGPSFKFSNLSNDKKMSTKLSVGGFLTYR
jgi:hypothetical protein